MEIGKDKNKTPEFLRMLKVDKTFTVNGTTFKKDDIIPQVQTPIGLRRNWNLLYCFVNGEAVGVNVKNVRQIL